MNKTLSLGFAFLLGAAAWAADYHPLDVKTGEWETTMTNLMNGAPPIPQELLDRMTPEQRAKFEAALKSRATQGAHTTTTRSCVTKDDLDKPLALNREEKNCTRTLVTSTSSTQDIRVECTYNGGKLTGSIQVQALNSENIKATSHMNASGGNRAMNVDASLTSKWVGPVCTGKDK